MGWSKLLLHVPVDTAARALNLTFTLGGPLSAAGVGDVQMMGTVQMTNGSPVQGDGIAAVDGNAAGMCEYFGTLSLEAAPDNGTAHDLYVNFLAGPNATFLLDTFGCEQPNASTITVQLVHSSSFSNLN